ncbi:MAG: Crp/Fnr family transcriptional regulator [Chloroflexi bacterium]|nr:Crp/Fnr family transcriptional regulator [Chloroflexota bacterium]
MDHYLHIIKHCALFQNIREEDLPSLLKCLEATMYSYKKSSYIFSADENISRAGIVLSGSVVIVQEDFWGNRTILTRVEAGSLFGEAFSCIEIQKPPIAVVALTACRILLINYRRIATSCNSACSFHISMIKNMLSILARYNIMLTQKIKHVTRTTTRQKLLSYLSEQAQIAASSVFSISFNRQELADYLAVDRSAMSNELSKMQAEGLIKYNRRNFKLLL